MRKILYVSLWLLLCANCINAVHERVMAIGSIQFPSLVYELPPLKVLYQGYEYPVEVTQDSPRTHRKGYFEVYVDTQCKDLYIFIGNLKVPEKNNVDHLKTSQDQPHRLFKLSQFAIEPTSAEEPLKMAWSIDELPQSEESFALPDNTIVLCMPPHMVARLEQEPWNADQHLMHLPKIVFVDTLSQKELQEAAARMALTLLDFELFHIQLPKRLMIGEGRVIAMPYPKRELLIS